MKYFSSANWVDKNGAGLAGKIVLHAIIWLVVLTVLLFQFPLGTVGAGERGVKLRFNAVTDTILSEGLYFRVPFVEKVKIVSVQVQKEQIEASAASKDLQTVSSEIALNYHINPERVAKVYQEVRNEVKERIIDPALQEAIKAGTAKYTAEELITKRELVKEDVKAHLRDRLDDIGVIVDEFNIVDFDFSPSFNAAIELKVTAEQNALAAKNLLEQKKYEAEQAIITAQGKAKALQVESDAIRSNRDVLELRAIEKWDGKLPQVTSGAIPFINLNK